MTKSILNIFSLGGLKIARKDEQAANTGSRKAETLMVYLASNQRRQAREVLADMLWDGRARRQSQPPALAAVTGRESDLE